MRREIFSGFFARGYFRDKSVSFAFPYGIFLWPAAFLKTFMGQTWLLVAITVSFALLGVVLVGNAFRQYAAHRAEENWALTPPLLRRHL